MKLLARYTEYTVTVCVIIGNVAAAEQGVFSGRTAALFSTVAGAAYALSRGLAKSNKP